MKTPLKLLFICTHNRCRSILCEAIANQNHHGVLLAKSAGSSPSGEIHPLTLSHLQQQGFVTDDLQSQSWDEHQDFHADIVFTVCDSAKGESCPVWFGDSILAHWGLTDPSKLSDSQLNNSQLNDNKQADKAFVQVIEIIKERTQSLATLAEQSLSKEEMMAELTKLGVSVLNNL